MSEQKKPPAIIINNPGELNKLEGAMIRKAMPGMSQSIVLELTHVMWPNPVRVVFTPEARAAFAQVQMGPGWPITIIPIFTIGTADVIEKKEEPL